MFSRVLLIRVQFGHNSKVDILLKILYNQLTIYMYSGISVAEIPDGSSETTLQIFF